MSRGSFRSRSSDHVPIVPTMVSSNPGVKRIYVFRNGDVYFQGVQIVINTHRVTDLNILLDVITQKIGLVNGAKKLYTMSGVLVKDMTKIKDNEKYVASSSHFTPMAYGGEKVAVERGNKEKKEHKEKHGRSKTKSKERKKKIHPEKIVIEKEEIIIPVTLEKPKKLKKKKKSKSTEHHNHEENEGSRPPSSVISGTAEVEIPSEVEDSEDEKDHEEHRPQNPSPPPEKSEKPRRKSIWCW